MNWGQVEGRWHRPAIIVGAGRSLINFDFSQLEGLGHIIAVNDSLNDLPFADVGLSIDRVWPPNNRQLIERFVGEYVWAVPVDQPEWAQGFEGVTVLQRRRRCDGLSDDPHELEAAGTSGHGALNYAYHKRPPAIFLFGFDYNGGGHYRQDRYSHEKDPHQNDRYWPRWADNFDEDVPQLTRAGLHVINASPASLIRAFPRCTVSEAVRMLKDMT